MNIVINGLARGGTNLLGNIFAAQKNILSTDATLCEFLTINDFLPTDFINKYPKKVNHRMIQSFVDTNINNYINSTIQNVYSLINPNRSSINTKYHTDFENYYGIQITKWRFYVDLLSRINSVKEIQGIYSKFSNYIGKDILVQRTTAFSNYASYFLSRSSDNYWIELTRDPFSRYVSSMIGHSQIAEQSFLQSKWQLNNLLDKETSRYKVISYESLCDDPDNILIDIYKWLRLEDKPLIKTITPDQSPFYGNSSDNENIFDQIPKSSIIYKKSINRQKQLRKSDQKIGKKIIYDNKIPFFYFFMIVLSNFLNLASSLVILFRHLLLMMYFLLKIPLNKLNLLKLNYRVRGF